LYGLTEVLVGTAILAVRFLVPVPMLLSAGGGSAFFDPLTTMIAMFTDVYTVVRGWTT